MTALVEDFHGEEIRRTRRRVGELTQYDPTALSEAERNEFERYIDLYNRVGYFCEAKFVNENEVLELWSGTIRNSWQSLESYVNFVREETPLPNYGEKFERLAIRASTYRSKRFGIENVGLESNTAPAAAPDEGPASSS